MKFWDEHSDWKTAEAAWEKRSDEAAEENPLRMLKHLPKMPGITPETAKNLRWKSLKYMVAHDKGKLIQDGILKHPLKYGWGYIKTLFRKKSYVRDGDFFLCNVKSVEAFEKLLEDPNSILALGFSYCHKPFECPSGRFTSECMHDLENPVCQQCFIGKAVHALPKDNAVPLFIPTIHYIGEQMFELIHKNPGKKIFFIITACEMALEMFADWGKMVDIHGIGVRLDGRICNSMRMFELSEAGVKPGLTVVLDHTQQRILDLIKKRRSVSIPRSNAVSET